MEDMMEQLLGKTEVQLRQNCGGTIHTYNTVMFSGDYLIGVTKEYINDKIVTITKPIHLGEVEQIITKRDAEKRELLSEDSSGSENKEEEKTE